MNEFLFDSCSPGSRVTLIQDSSFWALIPTLSVIDVRGCKDGQNHVLHATGYSILRLWSCFLPHSAAPPLPSPLFYHFHKDEDENNVCVPQYLATQEGLGEWWVLGRFFSVHLREHQGQKREPRQPTTNTHLSPPHSFHGHIRIRGQIQQDTHAWMWNIYLMTRKAFGKVEFSRVLETLGRACGFTQPLQTVSET